MSEYALMVKQAGQATADKAVDLGLIDGPVRPASRQPALKLIRGDKDSEPADFTFIDLFAGIGGLRRGFESIGGRCVFTSEWDKYSQKTYRANFPADEVVALCERAVRGLQFGGEVFDVSVSKPGGEKGVGVKVA